MQIVFQDIYAALNEHMTVAQIINEPLSIFKIKANVDEILDKVGLESTLKNRRPKELSGGQCRRVSLARALALNPKLLITDELTNGLDLTVQAGLLNLILKLQKDFGITFLFISHDLDVVEHIADRVAVMAAGKLIAMGKTEKIFANPQHEFVQKLLFSRFKSP
jgi:ABC-type glutathione transport system ATPase component